jgi:uncharacterized protein YeaO (DUF488 family)
MGDLHASAFSNFSAISARPHSFGQVRCPTEKRTYLARHFRVTAMSKIPANHVRLKRAYEPPAPDDGTRILIDRLWPRGVKKADAEIDEWMKEIAPSPELRKWFGHDPERWQEFRRRYKLEIRHHPHEFDRLRKLAQRSRITLVFSAHDEAHNDAVVLQELLLAHA